MANNDEFLITTASGAGSAEVTAGTPVIPSAAEVPLRDFADIVPTPETVRQGKPASGNQDQGKWIHQAEPATTSFYIALQGSGTATVAPKMGEFLKIAGLQEYDAGGGIVGYKYDGLLPCDTMTIIRNMYQCGTTPEGKQQGMRGAVANLTISADAPGAEIKCSFEVSGMTIAETDIAAGAPLLLTGLDTAPCEVFKSAPFTVGGVLRMINSFSFNLQLVMEMVPDAGNAQGSPYFKLTAGDPQLTCNLVDAPISVQDMYGEMIDETIYSTATIPLQNWDLTFTDLQVQDTPPSATGNIATKDPVYSVRQFTMVQK